MLGRFAGVDGAARRPCGRIRHGLLPLGREWRIAMAPEGIGDPNIGGGWF
jgi:hypothetical protein